MFQAIDEFTLDFPAAAGSGETHRTQLGSDFALRVLEEIDYGLILVSPDGKVQHANHLARHELAQARFLRAERASIAGATPETTGEIMRGIRAAAQGRRQMINLRHGGETLPVACVPLFHPFEGESASVLLLLGRQIGTQNLAVTFFARSHELTPAEECVLRALCDGMDVQDIAATNGVCESTVRTQVRALRDKTQCTSIRLLVQRVAALPPVVPVSLAANSRQAAQSAA
ncbi:MAG: LuxR C-terminal-related transcriptional regulator [Ramlibacter sp.]